MTSYGGFRGPCGRGSRCLRTANPSAIGRCSPLFGRYSSLFVAVHRYWSLSVAVGRCSSLFIAIGHYWSLLVAVGRYLVAPFDKYSLHDKTPKLWRGTLTENITRVLIKVSANGD